MVIFKKLCSRDKYLSKLKIDLLLLKPRFLNLASEVGSSSDPELSSCYPWIPCSALCMISILISRRRLCFLLLSWFISQWYHLVSCDSAPASLTFVNLATFYLCCPPCNVKFLLSSWQCQPNLSTKFSRPLTSGRSQFWGPSQRCIV